MQGERVYDPSGVSSSLIANGGGTAAKTGLYLIDQSKTAPKITEEARCITSRYTAGIVNHTAMNSAVLEIDESSGECEGINVRNGTKKGYDTAYPGDGVELSYPASESRRGRVGKGCSHTLNCSGSAGVAVWNGKAVRIRRLTPRECFRLQGFPDEYFDRAAAVNSDAQLYKQAGNGVTVNVVYAIGRKLAEVCGEPTEESEVS